MAAFIYMRNTPKGVAIFASDEVSAPGQRKRYLANTHPQSAQALQIMRTMHLRVPTYDLKARPTLMQLSAGIPGAVFIRGDGRNTSDRVLVKAN